MPGDQVPVAAPAEAPTGPEPGNRIGRKAEGSEVRYIAWPPTHVIWREDGPEFIHPEGYSVELLEPLPSGFWDVPMTVDLETRTFTPDVQGIRAAKWDEVKARRGALEHGVAYLREPLGPIQIDERSTAKIHGLFTMALVAASGEKALPPDAPPLFLEPFTRADNQVVILTSALALEMGTAVARYVSTIYAMARALRARIEADDATVAEVLSIDVEAAFAAALGPAGPETV
jgi:Domain of unknown function (DUF4376)